VPVQPHVRTWLYWRNPPPLQSDQLILTGAYISPATSLSLSIYILLLYGSRVGNRMFFPQKCVIQFFYFNLHHYSALPLSSFRSSSSCCHINHFCLDNYWFCFVIIIIIPYHYHYPIIILPLLLWLSSMLLYCIEPFHNHLLCIFANIFFVAKIGCKS